MSRSKRRLAYFLKRNDRARLLRDEMEIHLAMKTQELMDDGMPEGDARHAARRQFGNPMRLAEESRGTWMARWLTDLVKDTAFAARTLRKQPGFAAVAVLSAALGIGACVDDLRHCEFCALPPSARCAIRHAWRAYPAGI